MGCERSAPASWTAALMPARRSASRCPGCRAVGQCAFDVGKIVARDEPVEWHPARHEKIDKARDEVPRSTVALDNNNRLSIGMVGFLCWRPPTSLWSQRWREMGLGLVVPPQIRILALGPAIEKSVWRVAKNGFSQSGTEGRTPSVH